MTAKFSDTHEVIAIDGARIDFGSGWGLIRSSNTQPVLVLRFEGKSEEALRAIRAELGGALREFTDVPAEVFGE